MSDPMGPSEWAEVFNAGAASYMRARNQLINALSAMEKKCLELDQRGRLTEDHFLGKPVSSLTYEEAIKFRQYLASDRQWISEDTWRMINRIIAEGPESDRFAPIKIVPPTIIEGGQEHGRP